MVPEEEGRSQRLLFKHSVECASGSFSRLFSHRPSPACETRLQFVNGGLSGNWHRKERSGMEVVYRWRIIYRDRGFDRNKKDQKAEITALKKNKRAKGGSWESFMTILVPWVIVTGAPQWIGMETLN